MWGDPEVPGSGVKTFTIFSDRRRESGTIIKSIRYIFRKLVYSPSNLPGLSLRILRETDLGICLFAGLLDHIRGLDRRGLSAWL